MPDMLFSRFKSLPAGPCRRTVMEKQGINVQPIDILINPMRRFIQKSSTSGIILFSSAFVAILLANSPWADAFHHFWERELSIGYNGRMVSKSLHHWINDGLMAIFFFVVGLELKREIMAGELSTVRKAILPVAAAAGGMMVPAIIYLLFNGQGPSSAGWGIPMATDIAFALGVLFLLGDKVPISLKVFLTALAIADDIGAVLVIAFFYTSEIHTESLVTAAINLAIMFAANRLGVRSMLFYAIFGIGGLWVAFMQSGVHATIAAVLAAFTIPASVKVNEHYFSQRMQDLLNRFRVAEPNDNPLVTGEQLHLIENMREVSKKALTPLQRLEHALHPMVAFVIMPIFALANAGIPLSEGLIQQVTSPVTLGIFFGLLAGKFIGVVGMVTLFTTMKWAVLPDGMTRKHLLGAGFLAAIGFTMSLFISELAFTDKVFKEEAKLGILLASVLASVVGYFLIRKACAAGATPGEAEIR
jgi:NhaA family Na+:H+ antiporter